MIDKHMRYAKSLPIVFSRGHCEVSVRPLAFLLAISSVFYLAWREMIETERHRREF